ncbi:DUF2442 domain-containing protein [Mucilaginibacter sp. UYCu711]|uniref:DUF2442 domain-containing protein n=1 Tax=Mucilaginibacter sp. UYCu711 TaxID=3156339 RepID=UPI003D1F83F1
MNPRVLTAKYTGNHQLLLTFKNGEVKQFDFSAYLNYPVYEPLNNENFCKKVKAIDGIVQWDGDVDFDPDTLYLESKPLQSLVQA